MGIGLAPRLSAVTLPLLVSAAGLMACACASLPDANPLAPPPIAKNSPVAQEVERASRNEAAYPRFSDIPTMPRDIRPARAWSRSIYDTIRLRRLLLAEAAVVGPAPTDTEAFYRSQQARVTPPAPASAAAVQKPGATDTFVQGARERAKPPSSAR